MINKEVLDEDRQTDAGASEVNSNSSVQTGNKFKVKPSKSKQSKLRNRVSRFRKKARVILCRDMIHKFDDSTTLNPDIKSQIRPSLWINYREGIKNVDRIITWILTAGLFLFILRLFICISIYLSAPIAFKNLAGSHQTYSFNFLVYTVESIAALISLAVFPKIIGIWLPSRMKHAVSWLSGVLFNSIGILFTILFLLDTHQLALNKPTFLSANMTCAMFAAAGYWWGYFIVLLLKSILPFFRFPNLFDNSTLIILHQYLNLIDLIERNPKQWNEQSFKRRVISNIEYTAQYIYSHLMNLSTYNPELDKWLETRALGISETIRLRKRWIITPKSDTREYLLSTLSSELILVSKGYWDEIPYSEPTYNTRYTKFTNRLWYITSKLFTALIPAGGLYLLHNFYPKLHIPGIVIGIITTYSVTQIILAITSNSEREGSNMKDALDMLKAGREWK